MFDLTTVEGRRASNTALTDLFYGLQTFINPKTFLEIGAFDAHFSRTMKTRHPHARVIAFEASPNNYGYFIKQHDFRSLGIEYHHLAISDQDGGTISFQIQSKRNGLDAPPVKGDDSLLKRHVSDPHEVYRDVEYQTVTVDTITLDGFLTPTQFGLDDFSAWIDVEGALKSVLAGAKRTLERTQSLLVEVEEKPLWGGQWTAGDVEEHLGRLGFRPVARDYEFEDQYNLVFVKDEVRGHFGFQREMVKYYEALGRRRR